MFIIIIIIIIVMCHECEEAIGGEFDDYQAVDATVSFHTITFGEYNDRRQDHPGTATRREISRVQLLR